MSKSTIAHTSQYISQLDGFRAISVIAVIFTHTMPVSVMQWFRPGLGGVRLFFVISGFLITGILLDAKKNAETSHLKSNTNRIHALLAFYARRFLRIFPIYYLFVIFGFLLGVEDIRNYLTWHLLYLSNILTAVRGEFAASTGHLWSLSVEEQFYVFWPFVVLFIPTSRLSGVLWTLMLAAPLARFITLRYMNSVASSVLMPTCLDTLASGALIAYYQRFPAETITKWIYSRWMIGISTGLISVLCLAIVFRTGYVVRHVFLDTGFSFLFGCFVMNASKRIPGRIGAMLDFRPLRYIGRISYGIYLYHFAITQLVSEWLNVEPGTLNFLMTLTTSVVLATCSWYVIEEPMNRLKRFFPYSSTPVSAIHA